MVFPGDSELQQIHRRATTKRGWHLRGSRLGTTSIESPLTNASTTRQTIRHRSPNMSRSRDMHSKKSEGQKSSLTKVPQLRQRRSSRSRRREQNPDSEVKESDRLNVQTDQTLGRALSESSVRPESEGQLKEIGHKELSGEPTCNLKRHEGEHVDVFVPKLDSKQRARYTTNCSMPSLSSALSTDIEYDSISGSSSKQRPQSSLTLSIPSLASISSSTATSGLNSQLGKVLYSATDDNIPPIFYEQRGRSLSFVSISLELNDPQQTSELTLHCASPSPVSSEETSLSKGGEENRTKIWTQVSSQTTSLRSRHSSFFHGGNEATPNHLSNKTPAHANPNHCPPFLCHPISDHSSEGSLIGQQFLIDISDADDSQDQPSLYESRGSMGYSATSHTTELLDGELGVSAERLSVCLPPAPTANFTKRARHQPRSKKAEIVRPTSISPSTVSTPYDGILLQLVESIHGSDCSRLDDSFPIFKLKNAPLSAVKAADRISRDDYIRDRVVVFPMSKSGRRSTKATSTSPNKVRSHMRPALHLVRSGNNVSTCFSSMSSFLDDEASSSNAAVQSSEQKGEGEHTKSSNKAQRRRSANCSVSSNSSGESVRRDKKHNRRPPQKHPRRHSLGNVVSAAEFANRCGGSDDKDIIDFTISHDSSGRRQRNTPPEERVCSDGLASEQYCQESMSSNKVGDQTKEFLNQLDGTKSCSSHHTRCLKLSPVSISRKLRTEDLNQMRNTAPPRLGRIRSPRRRIIHIAHHIDNDRSHRSRMSSSLPSLSPLSDTRQRIQISKVADQLSIETSNSTTSLPPRSPGTMKSRSPNGKPPVDPKAKTVRRGNRSLDLMPEIADIKSGRRRSWTKSTSERQYRIIGLPPFVEDNEDNSSASSGSTSVLSRQFSQHYQQQQSLSPFSTKSSERHWLVPSEEGESSHSTMRLDSNPLPLTPRHRKPPLRAGPSQSSVSFLSQVTRHSDHSSSTMEPLSRIDYTFRNLKANKLIVRKGITGNGINDQHDLQFILPRPRPELGTLSVVPPLTDHRRNFESEMTCDESSQEEDSIQGSGIVGMMDTFRNSQKEEDSFVRITSGGLVTSTTGSMASYDLQPMQLAVPGFPQFSSHDRHSNRHCAPTGFILSEHRTSFLSEVTCDIPVQDSSEDSTDSFARHAATMEWSPKQSQVVVSPPSSPLMFQRPVTR